MSHVLADGLTLPGLLCEWVRLGVGIRPFSVDRPEVGNAAPAVLSGGTEEDSLARWDAIQIAIEPAVAKVTATTMALHGFMNAQKSTPAAFDYNCAFDRTGTAAGERVTESERLILTP